MKLITSPNRWSCLPASFAMALGISFSEMIARIGHDGSEIIWPELPEPQRRRTFHIQECLAVCLRLGLGTVEIQMGPCLTPDGKVVYEVPCPVDFRKLMSISIGVMLGRGRQMGHAVAWDGKSIYDPAGWIYDIDRDSAIFSPSSYFLISNQFIDIGYQISGISNQKPPTKT